MNNNEKPKTVSQVVYTFYKQFVQEIEIESQRFVLTKEDGVFKRNNQTTTPQQWVTDIQKFLLENSLISLPRDQQTVFRILINNEEDQEENDSEQNLDKYEKIRSMIFGHLEERQRQPPQELAAAKNFDELLTGWFLRFYNVFCMKSEKELNVDRNLKSLFELLNNKTFEIDYAPIRSKIMSTYKKLFLFQDDKNTKENLSSWSIRSREEIIEISTALGIDEEETDKFGFNLYSMFHHFTRLLVTGKYSMEDIRMIVNGIFNLKFNKKIMLNYNNMTEAIFTNIKDTECFEKQKIVCFSNNKPNHFTMKCISKTKKRSHQDDDYNNSSTHQQTKQKVSSTQANNLSSGDGSDDHSNQNITLNYQLTIQL
ncbi:hypothetical protein ACO0SA_001380 [Hanseniaspora valbyensis]